MEKNNGKVALENWKIRQKLKGLLQISMGFLYMYTWLQFVIIIYIIQLYIIYTNILYNYTINIII